MDFARRCDGFADLLARAGLKDVEACLISWEHQAQPDALWLGAEAGIGGIGETVTAQTPEVRARLRAAYDRLVVRHVRDGLLAFEATAVLGVGVC
jgi:hypothetical protein